MKAGPLSDLIERGSPYLGTKVVELGNETVSTQ
jgi:hypothetical protein